MPQKICEDDMKDPMKDLDVFDVSPKRKNIHQPSDNIA